MKMNGILTRRVFLGASVLAFQGVLLMPDAAHADQANASVLELDGSIEAREMWAEAVKRADQENSPIISSEDDLCSIQVDPLNGVYSNARTVSVSKRSQIGLINDVIIISADYGVTSTNRISPFNWARLYCSASSVKHSIDHRTVLDGGRTNAICFHAEIAAAGGWPTYVGDFYAEFYYTFTGSFM